MIIGDYQWEKVAPRGSGRFQEEWVAGGLADGADTGRRGRPALDDRADHGVVVRGRPRSSSNGADWAPAGTAAWPARKGHAQVTFCDRLVPTKTPSHLG